MKLENLIGKTLGELAQQTSIFNKAIHVFLLEDESDTTGKLLMNAFSLRQVIRALPASSTATVLFADEVCRETYIRIL